MLPYVGDLRANQLKTIKLYIDLDLMEEWIRKECPGGFDNPQFYHSDTDPWEQRLAEQFMHVYNKWKEEGEPPDPQVEHEELSEIEHNDVDDESA